LRKTVNVGTKAEERPTHAFLFARALLIKQGDQSSNFVGARGLPGFDDYASRAGDFTLSAHKIDK
jgi:hypothetical protein